MMDIPSIHPEQDHHNTLLQPSGCIDHLENIALWFAKRQDKELPDPIQASTVLFAADHGVARKLTCPNTKPTVQQVRQAATSDAVISKLCRQANCSLHIVDVGVDGDLAESDSVYHAKIRSTGTADITAEAAMSQQDYWEAVGIGEKMASRCINAGANLLIAGSISSGNRIAVAAIISELIGLSPEEALSPCPDSSPDIYANELMAVEHAKARATGTPSHDILRELGGLEIAAMAGFYRAAAQKGVPVMIDGLASAAAALAAAAWDVRIAGWMLASHVSDDPGHKDVLEELGLEPLIVLKRNIDKGKVATLIVPILQSAISLQHGMNSIEAQD